MRVAAAILTIGVLTMWWIKRSPHTADKPDVHRTISDNRNRR